MSLLGHVACHWVLSSLGNSSIPRSVSGPWSCKVPEHSTELMDVATEAHPAVFNLIISIIISLGLDVCQ
jgi:hypothetical protein